MVRQRISPSPGFGTAASRISKSPTCGTPVGRLRSRTCRFVMATATAPFERGLRPRHRGGGREEGAWRALPPPPDALRVLLELEAGDLAAVDLVGAVGEAQRARVGPHGRQG